MHDEPVPPRSALHSRIRQLAGTVLSLVATSAVAACHESSSPDEACAYYSGPGFDDVWICYEIDGDLAVVGDIILGTHEDLQNQNKPRNAIGGHDYYWPKARVPYTIAAGVPNDLKQRIADSIADYHANTPLRFVPKEPGDKDYVEFVMAPAGSRFGGRSYLGRQGGRQILELNPNLVGDAHAHHTVRHELGHAVGLTHEQVRPDRDEWIRVDFNLLPADWHDQYKIHGKNVLTYDYASIMHYRLDLTNDGVNEMTPLRAGAPANIGSGRALSQGDIFDLGYLYSDWIVPWEPLGNTALTDLQIATNADGRLEVFGLRNNGELWHTWQVRPRQGWHEWESLGGGNQIIAVGRNRDGRLELFSVAGNQLWHRWQLRANGTWSEWHSLGSELAGIRQMSVAKNRDGRLEVFARLQNGEIAHIWQDRRGSGGWSDWASLVDAGASDLAVKENYDGRIEVAWITTDGSPRHMWQRFGFSGVRWDQPALFDHQPSGALSDIELTRNKDGRLEIFATLARGGIEQSWQNGNWSQWVSFSDDGALQHVAEYDGSGRLEVFKLSGSHVFHRWQSRNSGGTWSDWEKMPGSPGDVTRIAVARNEARNAFQDAYLELFAIRREGGGSLFHTWRTGRKLGLPGDGGGWSWCGELQDGPCDATTGGDPSADDGASAGEGVTTGDDPSSASDASDSDDDPTDPTAASDATASDGTTGDGTTGDGTTGDGTTSDGTTSDGTTGDASVTGDASMTGTTSGDASTTGTGSTTGDDDTGGSTYDVGTARDVGVGIDDDGEDPGDVTWVPDVGSPVPDAHID